MTQKLSDDIAEFFKQMPLLIAISTSMRGRTLRCSADLIHDRKMSRRVNNRIERRNEGSHSLKVIGPSLSFKYRLIPIYILHITY